VLAQDITERIRLEEQLRDQALHDPLTRLANRLLLQDRIEHALVRQRRSANPFALLLLDLDNFKTVNDSLGHAAGDHLLVAVAGRLKSCLRGSDSAARLGGDEFAILLEEVTGPEHAASVAERLVEALRMPFTVEQREIFLGVSIGVAMGDSTRQSADEMLRDADLAMYAAKAQGRSRHVVFSPRMREAEGIGVAVMWSTCGARPSVSARRCSTPKRCCSSTTATPSSPRSTPSWISACVPTTIWAPARSDLTEPVRSATCTPSSVHHGSIVRKCCSASVSVGAISAPAKPASTARTSA